MRVPNGVKVAVLVGLVALVACGLSVVSSHHDWGAKRAVTRYFGLIVANHLVAAYGMLCTANPAPDLTETQYENFIQAQGRFDSFSVSMGKNIGSIDGNYVDAKITLGYLGRQVGRFSLQLEDEMGRAAVCDGPVGRSPDPVG